MPDDLLITPTEDPFLDIVSTTYPDSVQQYEDPEYLQSKGILTPINQMVDELNSYILNIIPGD